MSAYFTLFDTKKILRISGPVEDVTVALSATGTFPWTYSTRETAYICCGSFSVQYEGMFQLLVWLSAEVEVLVRFH